MKQYPDIDDYINYMDQRAHYILNIIGGAPLMNSKEYWYVIIFMIKLDLTDFKYLAEHP